MTEQRLIVEVGPKLAELLTNAGGGLALAFFVVVVGVLMGYINLGGRDE